MNYLYTLSMSIHTYTKIFIICFVVKILKKPSGMGLSPLTEKLVGAGKGRCLKISLAN